MFNPLVSDQLLAKGMGTDPTVIMQHARARAAMSGSAV